MTPPAAAGEPARHVVDPTVRGEFPGLTLWSLSLPARPGPSDPGLREQLRLLSDRMSGARALTLRRQPVPHAYRVFFRQVGLDPDESRTPIEQAVVDRLRHGGFESRGLVDDALLVALVETAVAVWALDEEAIEGELRLRVAGADDAYLAAGRLAVADDVRALLELFGSPAPGAGVTRRTTRIRLVAIGVPGVPELDVHEALFIAYAALVED